ncbi:MAG: hypothetical protein CL843_09325 [Crocinitomicaceae bacterium]|nr:hypothetical protein [Crocinitomicaceae bacterium]|tara:strand:- start:773 stop:1003 length:231 start_codon:yes stop_codon:yes gene_type:complete
MAVLTVNVSLICRESKKKIEGFTSQMTRDEVLEHLNMYKKTFDMHSKCFYKLDGGVEIFLLNKQYIIIGKALKLTT